MLEAAQGEFEMQIHIWAIRNAEMKGICLIDVKLASLEEKKEEFATCLSDTIPCILVDRKDLHYYQVSIIYRVVK